jgi:hypothetical protein
MGPIEAIARIPRLPPQQAKRFGDIVGLEAERAVAFSSTFIHPPLSPDAKPRAPHCTAAMHQLNPKVRAGARVASSSTAWRTQPLSFFLV